MIHTSCTCISKVGYFSDDSLLLRVYPMKISVPEQQLGFLLKLTLFDCQAKLTTTVTYYYFLFFIIIIAIGNGNN